MDAYAVISGKLATHPMGRANRPELDQILRMLFTSEEADIAQHFSFRAEPADVIAALSKRPVAEVTSACEGMAKKGVALAIPRKGVRSYALPPIVAGLFEYPMMIGPREGLDYERLRNLWLQYFDEGYDRELATNGAAMRVLLIDKPIDDQSAVLPFSQVADYIESAHTIAVGKCPCRIMTKGCDAPIETCFYFNTSAQYLLEIGAARLVDKTEAMAIFRKADDAGLVHTGANAISGGDVVCNCCPCCCAQLRSRIKAGAVSPVANYVCSVVEADCIACEACIDRCPTGSISVTKVAAIAASTCLGCGLCMSACPTDAMKLVRRPDAVAPFATPRDWAFQAAETKGRLEEFKKNLAPAAR